jgi:hypothetical protein
MKWGVGYIGDVRNESRIVVCKPERNKLFGEYEGKLK